MFDVFEFGMEMLIGGVSSGLTWWKSGVLSPDEIQKPLYSAVSDMLGSTTVINVKGYWNIFSNW